MSATNSTPSPVFDHAASELDLWDEAFWFKQLPAQHADKLAGRIKLAAKLLAKTAEMQRSKALEVVSHALRFQSWHQLSTHLARAAEFKRDALPVGWLDALSAAVILTVQPEDDVALPEVQLDAFERFGETLCMLSDMPKQLMLDGVSAPLCGGRNWRDVRRRDPLNSAAPLYRFTALQEGEGAPSGRFGESAACRQLVDRLDDQWQGYDEFSEEKKRRARTWVENALVEQPGFLEAGLALAWMQRDAGEARALMTAHNYVRQADALIPKGFKGQITWGNLGNRFYHRLLWLLMTLYHEEGMCFAATKVARKMLRLNPNDNLGVRYVLPALLLEQGELRAAQRAVGKLKDEHGLTAAALRAFVAYAAGDVSLFRQQLATALFTWPMLRCFLLNDYKALPEDEPGHRGVQPDMESFAESTWPCYGTVAGLRAACVAFLNEPAVQRAEAELRDCWMGVKGAPGGSKRQDSMHHWSVLLAERVDQLAVGDMAPSKTARRRRATSQTR